MKKFPASNGNGIYIGLKKPDHPFRNSNGYVREHVLIMEQYLRETNPIHPSLILINGELYINKNRKWCVHHINGKKDDNRISNLVVMTQQRHDRIHNRSSYWNKKS